MTMFVHLKLSDLVTDDELSAASRVLNIPDKEDEQCVALILKYKYGIS